MYEARHRGLGEPGRVEGPLCESDVERRLHGSAPGRGGDSPCGLFIISLDGTKQVNDAIRGKGSYDSTVSTIDTLIAAGKRVRVNTVVMQQTNGCIEELVQILHDKGRLCTYA